MNMNVSKESAVFQSINEINLVKNVKATVSIWPSNTWIKQKSTFK